MGLAILSKVEYTLFETPIGVCAIAWRDAGEATFAITNFQLPEASAGMTEARMIRHGGGTRADEIPPVIAILIQRVINHLNGSTQDFRDVPVDFGQMEDFSRRVLEANREIPCGQTKTYGEIAKSLGSPDAARAVGQAMGSNPIPLIVPCHRVVAAGGKSGGFSAPGGRTTKTKLLEIEGALAQRSLGFED
jgi:methylated-DNA-[protein]-cysteine S-methyltransferase